LADLPKAQEPEILVKDLEIFLRAFGRFEIFGKDFG